MKAVILRYIALKKHLNCYNMTQSRWLSLRFPKRYRVLIESNISMWPPGVRAKMFRKIVDEQLINPFTP